MNARLAVVPGAMWDGAEVVNATRMPDGRVAVRRDRATTVLVDRNDLELAGVLASCVGVA